MEMLKKLLEWCCPCCMKSKNTDSTELLNAKYKEFPDLQYSYTVRRISSFGRVPSQDDDSDEDVFNAEGDDDINLQQGKKNKTQQKLQTLEESEELSDGKILSSPPPKRKRKWLKALPILITKSVKVNKTPETDKQTKLAVSPVPQIAVSSPDLVKCCIHSYDEPVTAMEQKLKHAATLNDICSNTIIEPRSQWLKSQSMQNINHIVSKNMGSSQGHSTNMKHTTPLSKTEAAIQLARSVGLDTSLYITTPPLHPELRRARSIDNISVLDAPNNYQEEKLFQEVPYGQINFTVTYYQKNKRLLVYIENMDNLPPKGHKDTISVILKICILPNDKVSKTSRVLKPEEQYKSGEDFMFHLKDPIDKVLRISAYEHGMQGRYDAIGHTLLELEDTINGKLMSCKRGLYRQSETGVKPGTLNIGMSYNKDTQKVTVDVIQASKLNFTHVVKNTPTDKYNTYVKTACYYSGHKIKSKKSSLVPCGQKPVTYNHSSDFKITDKAMAKHYIVVTVMLKGLILKDIPVGRYIFGPYFYTYDHTLTPWGKVLLKQEHVTQWYQLYL